jgi:replication factor C small subunit
MTELHNLVWTERWRPTSFDDLILEEKATIKKFLAQPEEIPSFIFYSSRPGTGKSSLAKIISKTLAADTLTLNASMDRGIDTIREKVRLFAQSLSSNEKIKRLVFLDEADFITAQGQASLRNLMEEYSDNVFFILTANDTSKIIEPIRSRCLTINFNSPSKKEIYRRLETICSIEKIEAEGQDLVKLIDTYYPDIRSMILTLQRCSVEKMPLLALISDITYLDIVNALKNREIKTLYSKVYSSSFDILACNKWLFKYYYDHYSEYDFEKISKISFYLADTEKNYNLGTNLPIVFMSNLTQIMRIL